MRGHTCSKYNAAKSIDRNRNMEESVLSDQVLYSAVLAKADEIKSKLKDVSLSANQRKKYRKRLSRLYHGDRNCPTLMHDWQYGMVPWWSIDSITVLIRTAHHHRWRAGTGTPT